MPIPKILHFTWKTKTLPKGFAKMFARWQSTHADWDIRLWDDAEIRALVADHYPAQLAVFDRYPSGIFRADAFRFFVLHRFGGVYADLDMEPLGSLDALVGRSECFVGAEPELHVRDNDARYRGMPFVLCNAFMGSVSEHPFWAECIAALERCFCEDVVDATGPRFINGIALQLEREMRPDVLLPNFWSPLAGTGRPWPTPEAYADRIERHFRTIGRGETALVSHLWRNSWVMPIAWKGPNFWRIPNWLSWQNRRRKYPELAKVQIAAPSVDYDDQALKPLVELPNVWLAVDLTNGGSAEALAGAIGGLTYPRETLQVALCGGTPELRDRCRRLLLDRGLVVAVEEWGGLLGRNKALEAAAAMGAVCVLLDGMAVRLDPDCIETLLSAGRPVVSGRVVGESGRASNPHAFLYGGDLFKALYRSGARTGVVSDVAIRERLPFANFSALRIAPLTSVGPRFLLVHPEVSRSGLRFSEAPYKSHADSEGFAIAARDRGFEVCGMPNVVVTVSGL
jgi:hypothetical protein